MNAVQKIMGSEDSKRKRETHTKANTMKRVEENESERARDRIREKTPVVRSFRHHCERKARQGNNRSM